MEANIMNMNYESFGETKNRNLPPLKNLSSSTDMHCKSAPHYFK